MTIKKTVGQIVQENNDKGIELDDNVIEYTNEMAPLIVDILHSTASESAKHSLYSNRDFYVVLVKNVDRILGQPRFQCWARRSCPTPVYKQDVFKYHHISGELEYLWSIPALDRYWHIVRNKHLYINKKETARLAQFVLSMESGALLEWVKKENGELPDAIISNKPIENQILTTA